jgi:hypothetical protein
VTVFIVMMMMMTDRPTDSNDWYWRIKLAVVMMTDIGVLRRDDDDAYY